MDYFYVSYSFLWVLIISVLFLTIENKADMGKISTQQNLFGGLSSSQFTTKNNTKVIAQKGGLAVLPCIVRLISPATVSWIRRKDFQLLTVGLSTHSSDKRFLVEHTRHMGHWSLRIKSVREDDGGFYECQLSVYPTQSILIELKVVEAAAEIAGAPDIHVDEGSNLMLECRLKGATENPSFVFWYRYNRMVNYDLHDGFSVTSRSAPFAVKVSNQKGRSKTEKKVEPVRNSTLPTSNQLMNDQSNPYSTTVQQSSNLRTLSTSILSIRKVQSHHAGNYTCSPSNARPASVTVHVLRGESPAAMQHANGSTFETENSNLTILSTDLYSKSSASAFYACEPLGTIGSIVRHLFRNHLNKISFWQLLIIVGLIFTNQKIER